MGEKHLDNILNDIKLLRKSIEYKYNNSDIALLEKKLINIKKIKNIRDINIHVISEISDDIYQLNVNNEFSRLTDHISNEFYAYQYMLEESLKRKDD